MRKEEHALALKTKPELEQGREGIKKALKVLRKYYSQEDDKSHDAQDSGGTSIIGMLEVVESDIAKAIANLDEQEDSSQAQYEERRKRQETTLQGLQDAMLILQGKAALAQQNA